MSSTYPNVIPGDSELLLATLGWPATLSVLSALLPTKVYAVEVKLLEILLLEWDCSLS